jgi:hypothetical protein
VRPSHANYCDDCEGTDGQLHDVLLNHLGRDQLQRRRQRCQHHPAALGIEADDVVNHCFPKSFSTDREERARIIGDWLKQEARILP